MTRTLDTLFFDQVSLMEKVSGSNEWMKGIFGNMDPVSRKDAILFEAFLEELMEKRLRVEEFLDKATLERLLKNDLYRGVSFSNETKSLVDSLS